MYQGGQYKERRNKGALHPTCNRLAIGGANLFAASFRSYLKTALVSKSSRKKMSGTVVASALCQFLCSVTPPLTLVMVIGGPPSPTRPRNWPCFTSPTTVIGRSELTPPLT